MNDPRRWTAVVIYASAMALLEAAAVTYLRTLLDRIDPFQPNPLPAPAWLMHTEIAREVATLVMLGAIAWLPDATGELAWATSWSPSASGISSIMCSWRP